MGKFVVSRRVELGYKTRQAFVETVDPKMYKTISELERGTAVSSNSVAIIERALMWAPGSAEAILAGGEPTIINTRPAGGPEDLTPEAAVAILQSLVPLGASAFWEGFDLLARRRKTLQSDARTA